MTTSTDANEFQIVLIIPPILLSTTFQSELVIFLFPIIIMSLNGVRDNFASTESLMSECCVIGWVIIVEFLLFVGILTLSYTLSLASTNKYITI